LRTSFAADLETIEKKYISLGKTKKSCLFQQQSHLICANCTDKVLKE
jgi:hypothetical protein